LDGQDEGRRMPSIAILGIGGGGSRIISDGLQKIVDNQDIDRYSILGKALRLSSGDPLVYIIDTSSDPTTKGFYDNIPARNKISLSSSIGGMSRGAGGRPGRAAKAVLNEEVVDNLTRNLYKPISESEPAIVVIVHTADGGTGGGLTPEVLHHLAYTLPLSTIFWVFTVFPKRNALSLQGPRTVAPVMGKLLKVARRISQRDFTNIPYNCREVISRHIKLKSSDQSYEFQHSRVAFFPLSNHHFSQTFGMFGSKEIREEVLNPFPIEVLSQALYPFLKYTVTTLEEQQWMQEMWPLGPIDIPDIMAGVTPERPFVIPHLYIDPNVHDEDELCKVIENLKEGRILLEGEGVESENGERIKDLGKLSFTGTPAKLYEFRATSLYCIPIYPEGSSVFEEFGDFVSDTFFPALSGNLKFISGKDGLKIGVISHAANLKPQPIPKPSDATKLGFERGMLVTLIFGAVPLDIPIWLESTRDILDGMRTEDFWEISGYDATDWLMELSRLIGWSDWPYKKYIDL
jgi:hypothetical protein